MHDDEGGSPFASCPVASTPHPLRWGESLAVGCSALRPHGTTKEAYRPAQRATPSPCWTWTFAASVPRLQGTQTWGRLVRTESLQRFPFGPAAGLLFEFVQCIMAITIIMMGPPWPCPLAIAG